MKTFSSKWIWFRRLMVLGYTQNQEVKPLWQNSAVRCPVQNETLFSACEEGIEPTDKLPERLIKRANAYFLVSGISSRKP
jgi:hypothetical protein